MNSHWNTAAALLQTEPHIKMTNCSLKALVVVRVRVLYQVFEERSLGYAAQHGVGVMED